jgi:desulfoferrodoxin (superoxide reductase-like protein)
VTPTVPPVDSTGAKVAYSVNTGTLPTLRSDEHYVLWARIYGSLTYLKLGELIPGKAKFGIVPFAAHPDTVNEARITIESDTSVQTMGASLLGGLQSSGQSIALAATNGLGVGDLTLVKGIATFSTKSADTTRAFHEFYLMQLQNGTPVASLQNLPKPATGWHYAVWVADSSFIPNHLFYYGAFLNPTGHDSDSVNDTYAFPGGFEPPLLAGSNGEIELTIEPDFSLSSLKKIGPSPFPFLVGGIPKYLYANESVQMLNVAATGIPSAIMNLSQE